MIKFSHNKELNEYNLKCWGADKQILLSVEGKVTGPFNASDFNDIVYVEIFVLPFESSSRKHYYILTLSTCYYSMDNKRLTIFNAMIENTMLEPESHVKSHSKIEVAELLTEDESHYSPMAPANASNSSS